MYNPVKIILILFLVILVEGFIYNIIKPDLPHIPGDLFINKAGIRIYIPFVSALIISVLLTLAFNFFK